MGQLVGYCRNYGSLDYICQLSTFPLWLINEPDICWGFYILATLMVTTGWVLVTVLTHRDVIVLSLWEARYMAP